MQNPTFPSRFGYQDKLARFLENHDEPRAAATFSPEVHQAAAVITFLSPGLRFFHQGQFEGRRNRISPHLVRGPNEPTDETLKPFYERLLSILRQPTVRDGQWQLLECAPGWEGNWTHDCFLVFAWQGASGDSLVVAVNDAPNQSQCHVRLPFADHAGSGLFLRPNQKGSGILGDLEQSLGIGFVYGPRRQASFDDRCQLSWQVVCLGRITDTRSPSAAAPGRSDAQTDNDSATAGIPVSAYPPVSPRTWPRQTARLDFFSVRTRRRISVQLCISRSMGYARGS